MTQPSIDADRSERIVRATFARLDITAISVSIGSLFAMLLWAATATLLLKGAPPGQHIGEHLGLLGNYFPGYSVSWPGSVAGITYGFLVGVGVGGIVGVFWNLVHHMFLMFMFRRASAGGLDI